MIRFRVRVMMWGIVLEKYGLGLRQHMCNMRYYVAVREPLMIGVRLSGLLLSTSCYWG